MTKDEFIVDSDNRKMFEVFCQSHPHEAFELNKEEFLKYMHKRGFNIDEQGIIKLLKETE